MAALATALTGQDDFGGAVGLLLAVTFAASLRDVFANQHAAKRSGQCYRHDRNKGYGQGRRYHGPGRSGIYLWHVVGDAESGFFPWIAGTDLLSGFRLTTFLTRPGG